MKVNVGDKVNITRSDGILGSDKLVGLVGLVSDVFPSHCHVYFQRADMPVELLLWAGDPVGPYIVSLASIVKVTEEEPCQTDPLSRR